MAFLFMYLVISFSITATIFIMVLIGEDKDVLISIFSTMYWVVFYPGMLIFSLPCLLLYGIYRLCQNPVDKFHKFMMTNPRDLINFKIEIKRKGE